METLITVQVDNQDIDQVMSQIIKQIPISYTIKGETQIVLTSSEPQQSNPNQVKSATGVVISEEDGQPIIGATVLVKGTTIGTATDMDGKFSIANIPGSAKILQISFIGMEKQEVSIKQGMIKVELASDSEILDEVMVVAFGKQTRESFTGSAGVIKAEAITKQQVSNPISALNGKVAGVQMVESNSPSGSPSILIRGLGSINASTSPLIILDGLPYHGYWSAINPSDVESITVLKDAASNALYGARGANGVILVTTKTAKKGEAVISLDAKWGGQY